MENSLSKKIKQNITNFGPISIAEYMQNLLFDHKYGYYVKENPFGAEGDFITAPEISQIFGEIIGGYIIYYWQILGKPKPFQLIEMGPGRGELMNDILRVLCTQAELYNVLEVSLIELSPRLCKIQQEKLADFKVKITHYDDFSQVKDKASFIVANEFFDALPITQYQFKDNNWHERKVSLNAQDEFCFILEKNNFKFSFDLQNLKPKNNDIYEICYPALNIMKNITRFLAKNKSGAMFIDYGYVNKKFGNSLQAIKKHKFHNIFKAIGTADITAHVDFSALADIARKHKNLAVNLATQRDFFTALGFRERNEILCRNVSETKKEKLQIAAERILAKEQMGELFKVLLIEHKP